MTAPPFRVKAVYDYSSPHDDDLSFPSGQVITVVQEEDADWYIGEYNDDSGAKHSGLFPKNFVERIEPQAPPRPVRAKKEEPAAPPMESPAAAAQPLRAEREPAVTREAAEEESPASIPAPAPAAAIPRSLPPPVEAAAPARAPINASANEPVASQTPGKAAGPPVAEKPSSFRDRIAAFNKGSAAPVTPSKPTSSSTFIKKPFVAPPPARDAYIAQAKKDPPPQRLYRREEDPEIVERQAQDQEAAKRAGLLPSEDNQEDSEDAPRPTTLKERIALLQQQQAEQQARQMEAFAKEKPKRPQKKRAESGDTIDSIVHGDTGDVASDGIPRTSTDMSQEAPVARRMSKESRVPAAIPRDTFSDGNEADHSGAGEMTEGDSTEVEDHVDHDRSSAAVPLARSATGASAKDFARQPPVHEEEEEEEEEEEHQPVQAPEEEDEMDAETRRKLELRERMAKMSGGMGMGGMFGAPMGLPQGAPKKRALAASAPQDDDETPAEAAAASPRQRMPMMPLPGLGAPQVRSPPQSPTSERPPIVEKEPEPVRSYAASQAPGVVTDVEDLEQMPSANPRMSMERGAPPPIPQDRPLPPPRQASAGAPPVPGSRSVPMPPIEARAVPPPPPRGPMSPSAGSESDDEMSTREAGTPQPPMRRDTGLSMRGPPPPIPQSNFATEEPRSPTMASVRRTSFAPDSPSASSPIVDQRASRGVPPIPGLPPVSAYTSEARAAPRPPPPAAPVPSHQADEDEDEEDDDGEYEGDYDTDAPSATHRDVLRSHGRDSSVDTGSSEGFPRSNTTSAPMGMAPPVPMVQRAMPPLPPQTLDTSPKRSLDMAPRAVPPPPPSGPPPVSEEYDPYRYSAPTHGLPARMSMEGPAPPRQAPALPQQPPPPPGRAMPPPVPQSPVGPMPPRAGPAPPPPGRAVPGFSPQGPPPAAPRMGPVPPPPARQMQEDSDDETPVPSVAPVRRSVEQSRQSLDQGHIARDVDLGQGSQWWAQANMPPPVFQGRSDVLFEIEETSTPHRGGRTTVSKDIYVLFQDYSQTVITARFDTKAPADVALEQRHEPPPPRARQDQLEAASSKYGSAILRAAHSKVNHSAGDGTALGLVLGAIRSQPTALLPVGTRAYGALIYVNIANATVQQNDEIRAGDIISFRNAKFQGKHGLTKYNDDVGRPDHVAIVVEWDGTKKKIRAYEQGRESRKVKMESFKVGDLRSGEVKIWRPMGRQWVGWEGET